MSRPKLHEICGEGLSLDDLAELTGLPKYIVSTQIRRGWSALELLRHPPHERRACVVCGHLMRAHNKTDRCSKHGHDQTFDRATGECLVCGEIVQDNRKRGTHAQSHNRVLLTPQEVKERANKAAKRLRQERKRQGLCVSCGLSPPSVIPSRYTARGQKHGGSQLTMCPQCLEKSRKRVEYHARKNGKREKPPPETLTLNGETHTIMEWSQKIGLDYRIIWSRLKKGYTTEQALSSIDDIKKAQFKTHCKHGHAFTPNNTYLYRKSRMCKTCLRENLQARRYAKAAKYEVFGQELTIFELSQLTGVHHATLSVRLKTPGVSVVDALFPPKPQGV